MSISAMKYALQALENPWGSGPEGVANAIAFLRQAIAEAEKQEPLVWMNKYGHVASFKNDEYTAPLYTAPVHASDISQERVDETAKRKHEWVGLTDDEFQACFDHADGTLGSLMYAIEAKLKEKNT